MKKELNLVLSNIKEYLPVIFLSLSIFTGFINKQRFGGGLSNQILFFVLVLGSVLLLEKHVNFNQSSIYLIGYWFLITLATLSYNYVQIESPVVTFLLYVIFYIIITGIDFNINEVKLFINSYIMVALIAVINIIINFNNGNNFYPGRYSTIFWGVKKDPNYASAFIVPAVLMVLYSLFNKKSNKILNMIVASVLIYGVFLTGSRAAFIFLFFSFAYIILLYFINPKIKIFYKLIASMLILIVLIFSWEVVVSNIPSNLIERLTDFSSYTENTRLLLWERVFRVFVNSPLINQFFGFGIESSNAISRYLSGQVTHNVFIDILFAGGYLGFVLFLGLLIYYLSSEKEDRKYIFGLLITSLGPLLFINGFNTPAIWTPLLLLGILRSYSEKSNNSIGELF